MKKFISVLLALALCLSVAACAFAEETEEEVLSLNWEEVEPVITEAGWEGDFVTLESVGLKLWVPSVLLPVELDEESVEAGYIAYFMTEDEEAALGVQLYELGMSFDEVFAMLEETEGVSDLVVAMLNGAQFMTYTYAPEGGIPANVVTLVNDEGYALEFAFTAGDEGYEIVSGFIAASIQPADAQ